MSVKEKLLILFYVSFMGFVLFWIGFLFNKDITLGMGAIGFLIIMGWAFNSYIQFALMEELQFTQGLILELKPKRRKRK